MWIFEMAINVLRMPTQLRIIWKTKSGNWRYCWARSCTQAESFAWLNCLPTCSLTCPHRLTRSYHLRVILINRRCIPIGAFLTTNVKSDRRTHAFDEVWNLDNPSVIIVDKTLPLRPNKQIILRRVSILKRDNSSQLLWSFHLRFF